MPRNAFVLLAVAVLSVVLEGVGSPAARAGERWRRPLPGGAVVGAFTYERSAPYARGRRRGIDLAGTPGQRVVAACDGVVTHAGRVPAFGRGVTVRCGRLVATELGLSTLAVRRGAVVLPGAVVGRLAAAGVLRLGARAARDRQGYVDPLALLRDETDPAVPRVAPPAPGTRGRRVPGAPRTAAPAPQPVRTPRHLPAPGVAARPAAALSRWPVLAGLALLCAGLLGGGGAEVARRRRRRLGMAVAQR
jgi:hypothetical protein